MKKLYLFMTALLVAIAANAADWYLVGDPTGSSYQWTDREAYKLTQTSDTEYYIDVESLNGTWKIKEGGTWDTSFGAYNVGTKRCFFKHMGQCKKKMVRTFLRAIPILSV